MGKTNLLSRVSTPDGDAIVFTKIKYMFLFDLPRTSVMPYAANDFAAEQGFQVRYNTSDPTMLRELHETMAMMVSSAGWRELSRLVRMGTVPYPPARDNLHQYVSSVL